MNPNTLDERYDYISIAFEATQIEDLDSILMVVLHNLFERVNEIARSYFAKKREGREN